MSQYAVKFVCGTSNPQGQNSGIAAPGRYFTAINIHNPTTHGIDFRKKFALAPPTGQGKISPWSNGTLGPDAAVEVDCPEISQRTGSSLTSLVKGFAIIEPLQPGQELDVVAVYTAGSNHVETLETDRVPSRLVVPAPSCGGDLKRSVISDTTDWKVTGIPQGLTGVPAVPYPPRAVSGTSFGSQAANWITAVNSADANGPGGIYTYEYHFCLCQDFSNPALSLNLVTDNESTVLLNQNSIGTTLPNLTPATISTTQGSFFKLGDNVLTIRVRNRGGGGVDTVPTPTGMSVNGTITATSGACPTEGRG